MKKDLVIIGGGPAGLAAAVSAYDNGVKDILIIERDTSLGGILQQCIHNGFGLTRFGENITGPEYANRFIDEVKKRDIEVLTDTMVLNISKDKVVTVTNSKSGIVSIEARAIILAMGCRERSKGALNISGYRPAGIYSAGTAQKYINMRGVHIGKNAVILGSGDIGLIMARRLTLEGAKVHAVCEIMPYSSGLRRNIAQCLEDYDIPLYFNTTITYIHGKQRVEGVTIAEVDINKQPIEGTERFIKCDTVLFSVGLLPENELTRKAGIDISPRTKGAVVNENRQTSIDGIFACGNVLQVHDLVDFVSEEAEIAGKGVAEYLFNDKKNGNYILTETKSGVSYVVPQHISKDSNKDVTLYFRPSGVLRDVYIIVQSGEKEIIRKRRVAVAPGEMETIVLKKDVLASLSYNVSVSILEVKTCK